MPSFEHSPPRRIPNALHAPSGSLGGASATPRHHASRRSSDEYPPALGPSPEGSSSRGRAEAEAEAKRRKVVRACDVCRRKKIKCDGPMNSHSTSKCAHCQEYNLECTYVESAKRRGPPKGYVETLEQRCRRLERALQQLHPGTDFIDVVGPPLDREDFDHAAYLDALRALRIPPYPAMKRVRSEEHYPSSAHSPATGAAAVAPAQSTAFSILGPTPWRSFERDPNRPPDAGEPEAPGVDLPSDMGNGAWRTDARDPSERFHGKASLVHLHQAFKEMRHQRGGGSNAMGGGVGVGSAGNNTRRRPGYWNVPEWERVVANEGTNPLDFSIWPEDDLAETLIDGYFDYVNSHLPLMNKPIFVRQFRSGLHHSNTDFAKVCLMVFANGAQFTDDERIYWPLDLAETEESKARLRSSEQDGTRRYSAGWRYLQALLKMGRSIAQTPRLFELQTQVLICAFLHGSSVPQLTWIIPGVGLRAAQEVGIHVRSTLMQADPIERALYNRAFWCLYHIDRINCMAVGRSVALQDTDFDADYPIAVDDEYWETGNPETSFKQPESAGVSTISAFVQMLKLDHIIGAALRTIYAVNRLPEHRADLASQRAVVVELDSALNAWSDAVPDGLRWDPTRSDQKMFEQSAIFYAHYYMCQIMIHRPFIPTPRRPESVGLPSLAICSNASRSICNILDALLRRAREHNIPRGRAVDIQLIVPCWTAAILTLLGIYTGKQQSSERERAMADVDKCVAALQEMEITWRQVGKVTDLLLELLSDRPRGADPGSIAPTRVTSGVEGSDNRQLGGKIKQSLRETVDMLGFRPRVNGGRPPDAPRSSGADAAGDGNALAPAPAPAPVDGKHEDSYGRTQVSTPPYVPGLSVGEPPSEAHPWFTSGMAIGIESLFDPNYLDFTADVLTGWSADQNGYGFGQSEYGYGHEPGALVDGYGAANADGFGNSLASAAGGPGRGGGGEDLWAQVFGAGAAGTWTPGVAPNGPGGPGYSQGGGQHRG